MTFTTDNQQDNHAMNAHQNNTKPDWILDKSQCVIVGHSIDAITTATVMVSLGNVVRLYVDEQALAHTLDNYTFEYQQQALWQLYLNQQKIVVSALPDEPKDLFNALTDSLPETESQNSHGINADLYWLFYRDLPEHWRQSEVQGLNKHNRHKNACQDENNTSYVNPDILEYWVAALNDSNLSTQVPLVLSGISTLGVFDHIAQHCQRPWVYYVPFVFLQDGLAYASMLSPKLWLLGEKTADSIDKLPMLQPLMAQAHKSVVKDIATIEFARSAIMSMLATRVSFMNEWSRLADTQGVDITEVASIMGLDNRIGSSYLKAGWGFGGQTLPAEITALQDTLEHTQVEHRLMQAVNTINDDQKELIFRKFWQYFDGRIENKQVSIWGASYKSGSGRTSSAAIHPLLRLLWSYNITTHVYALEAQSELSGLYPDQPLLKFINTPIQQLSHSDAVFVMSWPSTKRLPMAAINDVVVPIFDAQNAFSTAQIQNLVGDYQGIGRGK